MKTNPNDSIYQHKEEIEVRGMPLTHMTKGLTKLEYFAAMAMQAHISGRWACPDVISVQPNDIAKASVSFAHALIEELNKQ